MTSLSDREKLLKFLYGWRLRILGRREGQVGKLTEEELGELMAINTIIFFVENDFSA